MQQAFEQYLRIERLPLPGMVKYPKAKVGTRNVADLVRTTELTLVVYQKARTLNSLRPQFLA